MNTRALKRIKLMSFKKFFLPSLLYKKLKLASEWIKTTGKSDTFAEKGEILEKILRQFICQE